jgi:hypothetical protein
MWHVRKNSSMLSTWRSGYFNSRRDHSSLNPASWYSHQDTYHIRTTSHDTAVPMFMFSISSQWFYRTSRRFFSRRTQYFVNPRVASPYMNYAIGAGIAQSARAGRSGGRSSNTGRGKNFSSSTFVHTDSEAHPASYSIRYKEFWPGSKAVGAWSSSLTYNLYRAQDYVHLYIYFPNMSL